MGTIFMSITYVLLCPSNTSSQEMPTWIQVVIAVLAILVTALISWQIYNTVNFERRIKSEVAGAKKDLENTVNILLALDTPPYLEVRILSYSSLNTLDSFKDRLYTMLNNNYGKNYSMLDTPTYMKVSFRDISNTDEINNVLVELQKEYWKRIKFDYAFILP